MLLNIDDLGVVGITVADWDITKSFKPKTITTDYSSWICYISRRPVPANTPITDTYYWKPITRLDAQLSFDYNTFKERMEAQMHTMQVEMDTFLQAIGGGPALTDVFGTSEVITVNQKAITNAFNKIWSKLEDITGESLQGISMQVTPTYFISEDGCTVHIAANTVDTNGIFEKITFYGNGIKFAEAENVTEFNYDHQITETTVIRCVAKIMGIEYERQDVVTHYNSYWLGCGSSYQSVMDLTHVIPVTPGLRSVHDVTASDNDHIIIILGESLADGFIRADMNGIEIRFTSQTITVDGKNYVVYTSVDTYEAGTYNIDING